MGRKCVCVGCSHFFCGGSVSAINNVSSYKDARLKSTKASSGKKNKKKRDQVRTRQTPGEPLRPLIIRFPFIYKEIQTMQTSFTKHQVVLLPYHSPNVHVVLVKRTAGVGEWVSVCPVWRANPPTSSRHHGPRQKHANISERYLQSRSSNTGNVRDPEMYTIILL